MQEPELAFSGVAAAPQLGGQLESKGTWRTRCSGWLWQQNQVLEPREQKHHVCPFPLPIPCAFPLLNLACKNETTAHGSFCSGNNPEFRAANHLKDDPDINTRPLSVLAS
jgi:hypothetical protein